MTVSDRALRLEAELSRRRTDWLSEEELGTRLELARHEIKDAADELARGALGRLRLCEKSSCGSRYYRIVVPRRPKDLEPVGSPSLFERRSP